MSEKSQISFDTKLLEPQQLRLLKRINHLLLELTHAENEEEYFQASAEAMRICASFIKQSNYANKCKSTDINYSNQAVEFALELLTESIEKAKVVTFDN